jgi:hypothetical protein
MSTHQVQSPTPVIDAKRRIISRARRLTGGAVAAVGLLNLYVILEWQSRTGVEKSSLFPDLGLAPETALSIVSICAVVVVGIVLADRSGQTVAVQRTSEYAHHQASAIIFSQILVAASAVMSFVGASALVRGFQRAVWPDGIVSTTAWSQLFLASSAAVISWVFVLLAAAATRTPFEIEAAAALTSETNAVQISRRREWLKVWAPRRTMMSDGELTAAVRSGRWSMHLGTFWVGCAYFAALVVGLVAAAIQSGALATYIDVQRLLAMAAFIAIVPTMSYPVLRRGISNGVNGRFGRGVGSALISFAISSFAIAISGQFGAEFGVATAIAVFVTFASTSAATLASWKKLVVSDAAFSSSPALKEGNWRPGSSVARGLRALAARQHLQEVRLKDAPHEGSSVESEDVAIRRYLYNSA